MAKAAAATALLDRSLNNLDGSSVGAQKSTETLGRTAIPDLERSSRKAGPEIDRLSGRMRLLADAAVTIGPALIPLGAAVVPALGAMAVGMTAAAGAAGVAALALVGVGDALGALNDYQLEPTADNLQAMRVEMEKLGPDGARFVTFLDSLTPQLRELQMTAREGFLPGAEEGIRELMTALPRVNALVADLASTMGALAADAGSSLAGDEFRDFFDYMASDAAPTLDALSRSIGNFAEGFANIVVGLAPATRDFTGGLQAMSERFAEWSRGLDQNRSFQEFVSYVRESGPMAVDALAGLAKALAGIVQAAAPLGQAVLPVLTQLFEGLAALASSDVGPPLFTAAAGILAVNRAASLTTASMTKLKGGFVGLGMAAAVTGAAIATGLLDSFDDVKFSAEEMDVALSALAAGDVDEKLNGLAFGAKNLGEALKQAAWDDLDFLNAADEIEALDQALAQLVATDPKAAADAFATVAAEAEKAGLSTDDLAGIFPRYTDAAYLAGKASEEAAGDVRELSAAQRAAAQSAQDFSNALSLLNGWLDKREALRNYKQGLDDLAEGFKNGFTREDAANLDAVGRSIMQVASQIKDKGLRADFLAGARQSLVKMAEDAGPKAEAAIRKLLRAMDRYGLTQPKSPKFDIDDKAAQQKLKRLERLLNEYGLTRANATAALDDVASGRIKTVQGLIDKYGLTKAQARALLLDQASGAISSVSRLLDGLNGKTATTYIKTVRSVSSFVYGDPTPAGSADGGTVPKTGMSYADRHPYLLADGEEVISNRRGQADRWRPFLKAINAGRLADGGTTGIGTAARASANPRSLDDLLAIAQTMQEIRQLKRDLAKDGKNRLDGLNRRIANLQLKAAEKELRLVRNREEREARQEAREKAKEQREELRDRASGIRDIGAGLSFDGLLPREEQTFAQQTRAEINAFKASVLDAGGVWDKSMRAWAKDTMAVAHEYQALSGAIELETATRDRLAESLAEQQSQMADLVRTMESYASSVAGNFLSNPFGQSRTETIAGAPGEASAALSAAQAQLAAIRSSATGDSVGAAAEASRLIAQIASLEERAAAEVAPRERTIDGLELFEETLNRDIEQARRMTEALQTLAAKGLDTSGELGLLYQQLAASGDVVTAEDLARLSASQIDEYERLFAAREDAAATVGALATQAVYGQQQAQLQTLITAQTEAIARQDATLVALNAELITIGADVQAGAAAGVAAMQPQLDAMAREIQGLKGAVSAIPRQTSEQKKKGKP